MDGGYTSKKYVAIPTSKRFNGLNFWLSYRGGKTQSANTARIAQSQGFLVRTTKTPVSRGVLGAYEVWVRSR